jgi:hypothetical protein
VVTGLANLDRTRLVTLGSRQGNRQDAVATFRLHALGFDFDRERYRTIEAAYEPFATMQAGFFCVVD